MGLRWHDLRPGLLHRWNFWRAHKSSCDIWVVPGSEGIPGQGRDLHGGSVFGAICGCVLVKAFQEAYYTRYGGGANKLADGYSKGTGLAAEVIGTFILVYTVFCATDPKRNARDSHVPVLAPLPIGFAVFMVHLATIPITGTSINPARSFGAAVVYGKDEAWDDQWMFWVVPFIGAAIAALYHQYVLRAGVRALGSYRSSSVI